MLQFEIPNLDGMSEDEVRQCERVFGLLAAYASHKANAMKWRAAGDIEVAIGHERAADTMYRRLPEWARW